jgi:hypothetical protein
MYSRQESRTKSYPILDPVPIGCVSDVLEYLIYDVYGLVHSSWKYICVDRKEMDQWVGKEKITDRIFE